MSSRVQLNTPREYHSIIIKDLSRIIHVHSDENDNNNSKLLHATKTVLWYRYQEGAPLYKRVVPRPHCHD